MIYKMKLQNDPFVKIKNKTKTIEMRLNDEKRKNLKLNDVIEFTNVLTNEKLSVKVLNLYHYNDFKKRLNENLKKISYNIGINKDISTYWARHTFATLMYEIGVSMDTIADCLGHKSFHNEVTLVYVKKSTEKIDAANRKLIDYILCK